MEEEAVEVCKVCEDLLLVSDIQDVTFYDEENDEKFTVELYAKWCGTCGFNKVVRA